MKTFKMITLLVLISIVSGPLTAIAQQEEAIGDENVKVASFEDMKYPPNARLAPAQGIVVVKVRLDDQGRVVEAAAISGSKYLIPDCLANAKQWRFQPNPTKSAVIVYNFRILDGLCHTITNQSTFQPPNFVTVTSCQKPLQAEVTAKKSP